MLLKAISLIHCPRGRSTGQTRVSTDIIVSNVVSCFKLEAGTVAAIIRRGKTSGKAFFGSEYTSGPTEVVKTLMPMMDSITQRTHIE
jgi:hypothetical protein